RVHSPAAAPTLKAALVGFNVAVRPNSDSELPSKHVKRFKTTRMKEGVAFRRIYNGRLVRERSASRWKSGLHLDCSWARHNRRTEYGEPVVQNRRRATHPSGDRVYCRGKQRPRATLRRLWVWLPRRVRVAAGEPGF